MVKRIVVLCSGGGTNLQALLDAEVKGILTHGTIVKVIADRPDAFALVRAKDHGVPAQVVARKGKRQETFERLLLEAVGDADLVILAGFLSILSPAFVSHFPHRMINVHPSLIPSFCGKGYYGLIVHQAVLARGVKVTGATVHFVNEIPDGGEIIAQKAVEVQDGDTPEILQKRVMEQAEWVLLPRAAEQVCRGMA
ncbi:MAG: phosphoribosylglycinamide formyltransferase [Sphaerochaeta sp.]|nr:phosphoribosylglycinamide formyltransferase [Sphaerochaeta sp.]